MQKNPLDNNRVFALLTTLLGFFVSAFTAIPTFLRSLIGKESTPLKPNKFLELLHFILVTGPKRFWKNPTAIGIGRSPSTLLHFILERDRRFQKIDKNKWGFTLIEIMVAMTIFAIILIGSLQAMGQIAIFRTFIGDRVDLEQDLHSNTEQLISVIKDGGTLDYEEYWNRSAVGLTLSGGHYIPSTGYGNYGSNWSVGVGLPDWGESVYYCRSGSGTTLVGSGGCLTDSSLNTLGNNQLWQPQRYGQYALQFWDFNSDGNGDNGDPDKNGKITGDIDDTNFGMGPWAWTGTGITKELYLYKEWAVPERTILRWNIAQDPSSATYCDTSKNMTGSGCLGKIEILRLVWKDYGYAHTGSVTSSGSNDWVIDTWECRNDFRCLWPDNTPIGADNEFVGLFSDDINVKSVEFTPLPGKNPRYAWGDKSSNVFISPYIRLKFTIGYGEKKRRILRGADPTVTITTTVDLGNSSQTISKP